MIRYTKGPWRYERAWEVKGSRGSPGSSFAVIGATGYIVATVWGHSLPGDETEANARLIASARDLLAACKTALEWIAINTPMVDSANPVLGPIADEADEVRAQLRAAIAKAEQEG